MNGSRLTLLPSLGAQFSRFDTNESSDDQFYLDAALHAHWQISSAWSFTGGVAISSNKDDQRYSMDIGVTLRW